MAVKWLCEIVFWAFLVLAALTAASARYHRALLARVTGVLALLAGLILMGGMHAQTGRPPLSGAYESLSFMALILSGLALASQFGKEASPLLAAITWGAVTLLLALLGIMPRQVFPDWFIYQFPWTRAFFLCRVAAMALLFYSSLTALARPGGNLENETRRALITRSRRFLILGTALFLVGEVSGFYWCLTWRGDYWRWNRNFLESTMIFLLASAALHLPPKLAVRPRALRIAYTLPGFLAITAYLIHLLTDRA
ncbi:MAG: hypothetical protein PHU44_11805 [Syntrophales bacterium]|nr:hypothetical protein [Syntrophales bacterium]MDD5640478.1 hypothetical protein [Syntrophales bacterium]